MTEPFAAPKTAPVQQPDINTDVSNRKTRTDMLEGLHLVFDFPHSVLIVDDLPLAPFEGRVHALTQSIHFATDRQNLLFHHGHIIHSLARGT